MGTLLSLWWGDVPRRRSTIVGLGGFLVFTLLAILVHLRLLASIDLSATRAAEPLVNPFFDGIGEALALAVSAEFSAIYAGIATVLLWRAGAGWFSVAPFAFILGEAVELGLKLVIYQPPVPSEFYRGIYYPLTKVVLQGTFPSGHAMRSAFVCAFLVILLIARGGPWARLGSIACVLVAALCGLSRVYLGYHWLSDIVAGLILGLSLALLAAPVVVERLRPG